MGLPATVRSALKRLLDASGAVRYRGRSEGTVHLTFDDGPDERNSPRILETLERYGARGTFFVTGAAAERLPALVREMCRRGHGVGSHLFSHRSVRTMTRDEWKDEVGRTDALLAAAAGLGPVPLRPPYGDLTPLFLADMASSGRRIVLWSDDSGDSDVADPDLVVERVRSIRRPGGAIVLLHEDYEHTVAALPRILEHFRSLGLSIAPFGEEGPR